MQLSMAALNKDQTGHDNLVDTKWRGILRKVGRGNATKRSVMTVGITYNRNKKMYEEHSLI